jgi:nucleotide-binding universal stress UspA family protein
VTTNLHFTSALEDFRRARRKATLRSIMGWMRGKRPEDLLSYENVRKRLRTIESSDRQLTDIPINSIVGSVNRYTDFTRDFLPKRSISGERWARVKAASQDMVGLPPIEVYQIGEVYFVQDGNHRVSIARQSGTSSIQAYVRQVHSRVPITADIQPDELIIKSEFLDFLEITRIDQHRPNTNLATTSPGRYPLMSQQIEAVRFAIEQRRMEEVPFVDAVLYWHDKIYLPIVSIIRENELLSDFPQRTETDLFIWLVKYQGDLVRELGWDISFETAATMIQSNLSPRFRQITKKLKESVLPQTFQPEPPIGKWRQKQLATHQGRLFADILVVIFGKEQDWNVLDFGCYIAKEEGSQVYGLCVREQRTAITKDDTQDINSRFEQYCNNYDVPGKLVFSATRKPGKLILERAHFADLVLLPLRDDFRQRRENLLSYLIHRCPTPIFAIHKDVDIPVRKGLLAYDGSPKAEEALFLATYLAKFWELKLVVLTVFGKRKLPDKVLANAYQFLNRYYVDAEYIKAFGPPGSATTTLAMEADCDLIISGGYGSSPLKKLFTGSIIDEITRKAQQSVLICK